jgi:hypothetical protein
MKASRIEKLELELVAEERRLRDKLLQILPGAADSGSNPFMNSEFNPSNVWLHQFHQNAEELLQTAQRCVELRNEVGLQSAGSVGALFLAACEENGGKSEQRRGPRKLAASLLEAISHAT